MDLRSGAASSSDGQKQGDPEVVDAVLPKELEEQVEAIARSSRIADGIKKVIAAITRELKSLRLENMELRQELDCVRKSVPCESPPRTSCELVFEDRGRTTSGSVPAPTEIDDKVDVKEQLRQAQQNLDQLQKAIPPLPDPHQLYDKIVSLCFDNFIHTKATTALEEKARRVIMSQPQETSEGNPLLIDMETMEHVVCDHLQTLSTLQSTLVEVRMEAQNEMEKKTSSFEKEVREKLEEIQKITLDLQNSASQTLQAVTTRTLKSRGEGIQGIQEEKEIIKNNESDDQESDINDDEIPNWEDREQNDEADHELNAQAEDMDENAMREQNPDREVGRRRAFDIELEIRITEQELRDFEAILRQYEDEPLCPPRRYGQGNISKANERYMKCVFCDIAGHYSDSCPNVRDPYARREIIISNDRCGTCLEKICARGATCKKYLTACYYCRDRGHHSGLCTFPDRSDYIRSRLESAQQGRIRSLNRLNDLQRERARRGIRL
ncbi:hypothetical protein OSTOST_23237 [Ostertagia ostertagi]